MKLNDRIERIKHYFVFFNVSAEDDATYVVVKIPQTWKIPDSNALKETYKVQVAPMSNGMCFATEIENGADCVFDAVDYVIKFNKSLEERKVLLNEKLTELQKLFVSEDIEKLKTLSFTFDEPKKGKKASKKEAPVVDQTENEAEPVNENNASTEGDSSLMAFAKNIVSE